MMSCERLANRKFRVGDLIVAGRKGSRCPSPALRPSHTVLPNNGSGAVVLSDREFDLCDYQVQSSIKDSDKDDLEQEQAQD
jgi:hypothetical protein